MSAVSRVSAAAWPITALEWEWAIRQSRRTSLAQMWHRRKEKQMWVIHSHKQNLQSSFFSWIKAPHFHSRERQGWTFLFKFFLFLIRNLQEWQAFVFPLWSLTSLGVSSMLAVDLQSAELKLFAWRWWMRVVALVLGIRSLISWPQCRRLINLMTLNSLRLKLLVFCCTRHTASLRVDDWRSVSRSVSRAAEGHDGGDACVWFSHSGFIWPVRSVSSSSNKMKLSYERKLLSIFVTHEPQKKKLVQMFLF